MAPTSWAATCSGRSRGEWSGEWDGWWGAEPPYHAPVFVLTHQAREPIELEGGTTFHFVTEGFAAAYAQALETADGNGVDIAGGASTVRQALNAGVIDELVLDIAPVLLGSGRAHVLSRRELRLRARRGAPLTADHPCPLPQAQRRVSSSGPSPASIDRRLVHADLAVPLGDGAPESSHLAVGDQPVDRIGAAGLGLAMTHEGVLRRPDQTMVSAHGVDPIGGVGR